MNKNIEGKKVCVCLFVGCFLCGNVEADLVTELISETGHGEMEKRMTTVMIVVTMVTRMSTVVTTTC